MIVKEFTLTPELKARAFRETWWMTPSGKIRYVGSLGVVAFFVVYGAAQLVIYPESGFVDAAMLWLLALIWTVGELFIVPAVQRRRFRRQGEQAPALKGRQVLQFSTDGIRGAAEASESVIGWDNISRVKSSKHTVAFFITQQQAFFVPRDLFTHEELAQVLSWAER